MPPGIDVGAVGVGADALQFGGIEPVSLYSYGSVWKHLDAADAIGAGAAGDGIDWA